MINISTHTCNLALIDRIIALGGLHFQPGDKNLNKLYLSWLLLQNPFGDSYVVTAEENGVLIGMTCLIPLVLSNGHVKKKCFFAANVLSHPQHRGKNIFLKIIDEIVAFVKSNDAWLIGHPNRNALPGWKRKKMQFRNILKPYIILPRFSFRSSSSSFEVKFRDDLPEIITVPIDSKWRLAYSKEFLSWRYIDNPYKSEYRLFCSTDPDGKIFEFYVLKKFKLGFSLLVDWLGPNSLPVIARSFSFVLAMLPEELGRASPYLHLKLDKEIPYFVTVFDYTNIDVNFEAITLGASDF